MTSDRLKSDRLITNLPTAGRRDNKRATLRPDPAVMPFDDTLAPAMAALEACGVVVRARRGQIIPLEPGNGVALYAIRSGLLALSVSEISDRRHILNLLYPGDVFTAEIAPALPGLSLVAQNDCVLIRGRMPADGDPAIQVVREAARRSAALLDARAHLHIARLAGLPTEGRVAAFLLELGLRTGRRSDDTITCDIPLSRGDIADYLALNADTLSRVMTRLKAHGALVTIGRSRAILKNLRRYFSELPVYEATLALHGKTG